MPDVCYDKCKSAVDEVVKADTTDICEGTALSSALQCLEQTGMNACSTSVFAIEHNCECNSNTTTRALEEAEEPLELLVNETTTEVSASRQLFYGKCPFDKDRPGGYM